MQALGVIIGVIAVTTMSTAIRSVETVFDRSMKMLGSDVLYVEQAPWSATDDFWEYKNRPDIRPSTADALNRVIANSRSSLLEVAVAAPSVSETVAYGKRAVSDVNLIGTNNTYAQVLPVNCQAGRFLDEDESRSGRNVCVIGSDVADSLFDGQDPVGQTVRIGQQRYRVIGVFQKQGSFLGLLSFDSDVVIPLLIYEKYFQTGADNASILVKTKDPKRIAEAQEQLRGELRRIRAVLPGNADNFTINEQEGFRSTITPIKTGIEIVGLFVTSLALFVGAIGIANMTFISVKERTREIGTRMAVGASRRMILLQFLIEPLLICVLAGVIGLLVSFLLCVSLSMIYPELAVTFSPELPFLALAISIASGVGSGLAPAWKASRLSPVEALRYE
jgi:putative ABC transport system permease protein